ncbi:hypothetical protein [Bacillus sp. JJ1562]|uniref:hypothetical protein n=1 Tax=Bacillus sp. JJ1562 TaxID=3122960 RepID=UPI0030021FFC
MKKVKVKYIDKGWEPPGFKYFDHGIVFENGYVLAVDEIGGTELYKWESMEDEDTVIVNRIKDDTNYLLDNPELLVNLITNGGTK